MQTRDHLLKECPKWKDQQKVLWKEVWKETEKRKWQWKAHKLFADARCSQAVLDFLASTEVGKTVPAAAVEENADTRSEALQLELWREREDEEEAEALGARDDRDPGEEWLLFLPTPPFMAPAREGDG